MAAYEPVVEKQESSGAAATTDARRTSTHLIYIDNLRTVLIILVVVTHLAIVYGGLAVQESTDAQPEFMTAFLLAWFTLVNQAFLLGTLFFVSGYFTPRSYAKSGPWTFVKKRLLRLGIPLLIYDFLINPPIVYWQTAVDTSGTASIGDFFSNYFDYFTGIGTGPMWFVGNLLLFDLAYAGWRLVTPSRQSDTPHKIGAPGTRTILGLAAFLTIVVFLVRLAIPVGWENFFNLRLQYYPQFLAFFVLGILAYRHNWLAEWPTSLGKLLLTTGIIVSLTFPGMLMLANSDRLRGGPYIEALLFSAWEVFVLIGLGLGLLLFFREHYTQTGKLRRVLSRNNYAVYLIHVPIIFLLGLALADLEIHSLAKFGLTTMIAVPLCYLVSHFFVRRLPFADRIL